MNISFEISHDIEQQLRTEGVDFNREAKEVYLMEQYRQAKLSHRQLQEAPGSQLSRDRTTPEEARLGPRRGNRRIRGGARPSQGGPAAMIVVCDMGPLHYLVLIGCDHILPAMFDRVLTARVIIDAEMSDPSTPEPVRRWAASPPRWLEVREPTHVEDIPSLGKKGVRGDADRAVISLALEERADFVLMDDVKARKEVVARKKANQLELEPLWTLEVLDEAAERGLIDDLPVKLDALQQQTSFYVGEKVRLVMEGMKQRDFERKQKHERNPIFTITSQTCRGHKWGRTHPAGWSTTMSLIVSSTAFASGKPIPRRHSGDGEDLSPPLSWSGVPSSARELALIVDDPDAPTPEPWVHWVIYKIPVTTEGLAEGVPPVARPGSPADGPSGQEFVGLGRLPWPRAAERARRASIFLQALCSRQRTRSARGTGQTEPAQGDERSHRGRG